MTDELVAPAKAQLLQNLFDELQDTYGNDNAEPGEFSARDFAEQQNMTWERAKQILERAFRDKKLTRRTAVRNGKKCFVYKAT